MSGGDDIACFTRVSRGRACHEAGRVALVYDGGFTRPTGVSVFHVCHAVAHYAAGRARSPS